MEVLQKIRIGIFVMDKKGRSKYMAWFKEALSEYDEIDIIHVDENVILSKDQEEWPTVDILVSFFSDGFPMEKAIAYSKRVGCAMVNDLEDQLLLLSREKMLSRLAEFGVPVLPFILSGEEKGRLENGILKIGDGFLKKPFVEKPLDAEDHNVWIYHKDGTVCKLFRKTSDDRCSELVQGECHMSDNFAHSQVLHVEASLRVGKYIYEPFIEADSENDIKVYVVGSSLFHAEARRAPWYHRKVTRTSEGLEERQLVALTDEEKDIAKRVGRAFNQNVFGFDLLRSNGNVFVCDVNGWSFVKNDLTYYTRSAAVLRDLFVREMDTRREKC